MNKSFRARAVPIVILTFLCMYMYSGLQTDHTNVLQPYMAEVFGWSALKITNPMTYGGYFAIIFALIVGTLLIKFGVKKIVTIGLVVIGVACIGLGISIQSGGYPLYAVSLFFVRSFVVPLFMGSMMFCTNWFVGGRGRIMGLVTIGCPLETATLVAIMTKASSSAMGLSGAYIIIGIINVILGIVLFVVTKDTPEECGLYPDGADAPVVREEEGSIKVKEVFTNKNAWLLMVGMGLLQFMIICNMAFFVTNCQMAGTETAIYLAALTAGSILGIPLSYLLGMVDDKFGTVKACYVLIVFFFLTAIGMYFIKGNNIGVIVMTAIGMAGITGATPNLLPSLTAYIFGRKNYQSANRWTFTIISVFGAFAVMYMASFLDMTGTLKTAYLSEIVLTVIALVCFLIIGRTPDHDRGEKAE